MFNFDLKVTRKQPRHSPCYPNHAVGDNVNTSLNMEIIETCLPLYEHTMT